MIEVLIEDKKYSIEMTTEDYKYLINAGNNLDFYKIKYNFELMYYDKKVYGYAGQQEILCEHVRHQNQVFINKDNIRLILGKLLNKYELQLHDKVIHLYESEIQNIGYIKVGEYRFTKQTEFRLWAYAVLEEKYNVEKYRDYATVFDYVEELYQCLTIGV